MSSWLVERQDLRTDDRIWAPVPRVKPCGEETVTSVSILEV